MYHYETHIPIPMNQAAPMHIDFEMNNSWFAESSELQDCWKDRERRERLSDCGEQVGHYTQQERTNSNLLWARCKR